MQPVYQNHQVCVERRLITPVCSKFKASPSVWPPYNSPVSYNVYPRPYYSMCEIISLGLAAAKSHLRV